MLLKRIYLRNYRVYEDELDLDLPPGLVGIYGANGAGKSALIESVLFCLWGRARTSKEEVRTTGVNGDCIAEVTFEHEGHLYTVRRIITGSNDQVKASAFADGQQVAESVRDTARYVHSVLGMDDAAFRSSVFAEQKQLAAFSLQRPQQRRDLVLKLLGVMPLDTARDEARKDARAARDQLERLTTLLPDLDELRTAVADAGERAAQMDAEAAAEAVAATAARERLAVAQQVLDGLEELRRAYDEVVGEGRLARAELDSARRRVAQLADELSGLDATRRKVADLQPAAEGLAEAEAELVRLEAVAKAAAVVARITVPDAGDPPDEAACDEARVRAGEAATALAALEGELAAAGAELARAKAVAETSGSLTGEADCPLCGQALGAAFGQVQAHRAADVRAGEERVAELEARRAAAATVAGERRAAAEELAARLKRAQEVWAAAAEARTRRAAAEEALAEAEAALGRPFREGEAEQAAAGVRRRRAAATDLARLQGLLERAPALAAEAEAERTRQAQAEAAVTALLEKARSLGFAPERYGQARSERDTAATAADQAGKVANDARVVAERARAEHEGAARRLAEGERQHATLTDLREETRHRGRVADLLHAFRGSVVGSVGPVLAAHAAELFAELTDREYDQLELDPETYEIQIRDKGKAHGMSRFSGSETDLANLAVRVAISEHVRLLSGGTVGLLVLDEVFGPLDEDRKARMLAALERLKGRFRQVLVVTHDDAIKAELPNAIEVVKLPGRRATARLLHGA